MNGGAPLMERVILAIVAPVVLGLVGLGFAAIVLRHVAGGAYALVWAEEVIRYGFVWVFWLVAPVVVRRDAAFEVDLVTRRLPPRVRRTVELAGRLGVLVLLGTYVWWGLRMVAINASQLSTSLEVPMSWVYLAIPVGALGMAVEVARKVLRR